MRKVCNHVGARIDSSQELKHIRSLTLPAKRKQHYIHNVEEEQLKKKKKISNVTWWTKESQVVKKNSVPQENFTTFA